MVAAIGTGDVFSEGRGFAALLGFVPCLFALICHRAFLDTVIVQAPFRGDIGGIRIGDPVARLMEVRGPPVLAKGPKTAFIDYAVGDIIVRFSSGEDRRIRRMVLLSPTRLLRADRTKPGAVAGFAAGITRELLCVFAPRIGSGSRRSC